MSGGGPREVREELRDGEVPLWVHPEWEERFPWLAQGTTGRGDPDDPFDLGWYGAASTWTVVERWRTLRAALGVEAAVHARQVHGAEVRRHTASPGPGMVLLEGFDGHVSELPSLLLSASVADCVPVSLVDPVRRAVALVHAGWRGAAAGIVERAVAMLRELGSSAGSLHVHLGPAICGRCYEVGPEVHEALRPDRPPPSAAEPVDLRAAIADRAQRLGVPPRNVTVSAHCTRCGPDDFFSHRGGSRERQMGVLGLRG